MKTAGARLSALAVGILAFATYAATAARTITWWDGSQYPLAAVTLGIPAPPGSLLLTLMGWLVSKLPLIYPVAFRLNLFAALLAGALAALVTWIGIRLSTSEGREPGWIEVASGATSGLLFAFALTPWAYATQFTPYVLSELWTALILVAALAWWRRPESSTGYAGLFVLFLLLGLDVSVHRTNLLLLPAALVWVLIRRPAAKSRGREAGTILAGLAVGLAFHLLLIPLAARHPAYMSEDPSDLASWWSYVSLEMKGGGFLVKLFPRTADFLRVQVADYLVFLARNLSMLSAALLIVGWLVLLQEHPRRAWGLLVFFLCAAPGAILYFNLPHGYFRPIDRHYLPSLVILSPWVAVGAAAVVRRAEQLHGRAWVAPALAVLIGLAPLLSWIAHWAPSDLSRNRYPETFARDVLQPLPERAILLTNGDNDSFPLWYLQQAEGLRRDVTVLNLPLSNTATCAGSLRRSDPVFSDLLPHDPVRGLLAFTTVDSTVISFVDARADLGLPVGVEPPETVTFHLKAPIYGQDRVVLDIFRLTRWRRPVYLASTVPQGSPAWLWTFARLDGLSYRIVPTEDASVWDVEHCRKQLFERVSYAGIADRKVAVDVTTASLLRNYSAALLQLAMAEARLGHANEARAALALIEQKVPPDRVGWSAAEFAESRRGIEAVLSSVQSR